MAKQEAAGSGGEVPEPSVARSTPGPRVAHYALAVAAVAVATLLRWLLDPALGDAYPVSLYYAAIILVAWFTRLGPSIVALLLGAYAADFFFIQPRYTWMFNLHGAVDTIGFMLYVVVGITAIAAVEHMRRLRVRAEAHPELLRVTLANIGEGVITTDVRGNVDFLNPVAEALTGWTREEAVGRSLTEVFHIVNRETRAQVENPALRAVREGTIVGLANHTILIARDGTERHIADSAAPIRSKDDQIIGGVLVFRDVTASHQAEVELRRVDGRFRLAAQVAGLAVAEIDYATGQVHLSPESAVLFGLPPEPLVVSRASIHSMFHPDDRPALEKLIAASYDPAGTGEFAMDHRIIRPDGQVRWHSVRKQVFFENQQRSRSLLAMFDITEHKRQEKLVQDAFDYATNILDTQRDPFLVLDKDLRVVSANRSFYKSFRVEKDATQGRFAYDLGDGQWNIPALRELLEDVLPKNQAFDGFEVKHDFPAGVGQKTMLINARRIRKPGDDSELILLSIEDITEQKESQQALLASHARFETLFHSSPVGMYMVDADFRLRNISEHTRAVFGDIKDLMGRDFAEVVHILWPPQVAAEILTHFRRTLATGECYRSPEFSAERFDHKVHEYYDWQIHRIALPDGRYGVVCYFLDISARVLAEQSLRDSEVRYRRLFETAKDGILILDAHTGKITDANAFMCGLTGLEKSEILGKELFQIGMYKDIEENKAAFSELQRIGYLRHDHLPVSNQRGEKVAVEFVANVYQEGDRLVAQCNVRDISERSRLEKAVAVQTDALAAQARAKDEFLAMLSHELRNPLAPIRAAAHLMRLQERGGGASANPILQQAREIIERQVANLTRMVSDLSEVSCVISGRIRLDLRAVDMKQVVEHAVQSVTPLFEQRKHAVSVSLCSEPVWAHADPMRLEEVLVNLLNNAAKYTPDGGRIAIACELRRERGKDYAMVRVRDNGVGIEESLLPRVFDLFTQGDRSLERSWGGLGIGLSLASRLMAMHGGTIEAHSAGPGKGSEFTVKLPLIAAPKVQSAAESRPLDSETPILAGTEDAAVKPPAVRVLVVDDNIDLVTMLCGTLRLKGFIVQSAYEGSEGLRIAQEWRPDIALLDIGLPGLDGYQIARRLRAENVFAVGAGGEGMIEAGGVPTAGTGPRMKLIAITGYGREDDIAHAREAGFDGHLVKPCDMELLEEMMAAPAKG
jgi:PAS domain S-box-containing protein